MESVKIIPNKLTGTIKIPPSKSVSHRAIICAGLANGDSNITNLSFSEDITATLNAMKGFGVEALETKCDENGIGGAHLKSSNKLKLVNNKIECNESGSTARFLIPFAGLFGEEVFYTGKGKLVERPFDTYYRLFDEQGIKYENVNGKLPLCVNGKLKAGTFKLRGDISSQFISGLLFVLPLLDGDSKIVITTELESKGYVDLTLEALAKFGIDIVNKDYKELHVKGNQEYKSRDYRVEGDFSQAAFWIVAGILGGDMDCTDIDLASLQGDKAIIEIVKAMGADISTCDNNLTVKESGTSGVVIDASQCPDLVPILTTLAAVSKGTTRIINAQRLRIKESDRLMAMRMELNVLGADVTETEDGLIINGKENLTGGMVDSHNDHRIAMALAVASIKCLEPVVITGSDCVKKSYPRFWQDYSSLGGVINEYRKS